MIELNLSKNIFFYHLNNKSGQIVDKRLIRTYPYLTISTSSETKYELLKETNCDINKLIQSNKEYKNLLDFDISQFNCITFQNNSDAVMQRRHSPFKNSYINLFVAKCQNDSGLNITDCFPENEINEFIENNTLYINLFLESSAINHHNYSYPLTKKYYQNSMSIPKDFIFSYSFFWRRIEYYTRNPILLFNYLFQSSSFILDHTIKDKDIYSTKTNFYVDKTIGIIQFLITVEYVDSYIRKYKTLIESLTILMSVFNIITNFCYILNHLCTKSYIYCTIFEPIVYDSKMKTLRENLDKKSSFKNINSINNSSCIGIYNFFKFLQCFIFLAKLLYDGIFFNGNIFKDSNELNISAQLSLIKEKDSYFNSPYNSRILIFENEKDIVIFDIAFITICSINMFSSFFTSIHLSF